MAHNLMRTCKSPRFWWAPAIAIGMAALAGAANGQSPLDLALQRLVGTTSVSFSPSFTNGALSGCGIEFNALIRNYTTEAGRYERVAGSFGFMMANKTIAPILKVVTHRMNLETLEFTPDPPKRAYVTEGGKSNASAMIGSYPSDTPGAFFSVFKVEPTAGMYFSAITTEQLSVRYGRAPGMDIPVLIDLTVIDTKDSGERVKSRKHLTQMLDCMKQMLKDAE